MADRKSAVDKSRNVCCHVDAASDGENLCPYVVPALDVSRLIRSSIRYFGQEITVNGLFHLSSNQVFEVIASFASLICEFEAIGEIMGYSDPLAQDRVLFPQLGPALKRLADHSFQRREIEQARLLILVLFLSRWENQSFRIGEKKLYDSICDDHECDWMIMWRLVTLMTAKPSRKRAATSPIVPRRSARLASTNSLVPAPNAATPFTSADSAPSPATTSSSSDTAPDQIVRGHPMACSLDRAETRKVSRSSSFIPFIDKDRPAIEDAIKMDYDHIRTIPNFDSLHFHFPDDAADRILKTSPIIDREIKKIKTMKSESRLAVSLLAICTEVRKKIGDSPFAFVECGNQNPVGGEVRQRSDFCLVNHDSIPDRAVDRYWDVQTDHSQTHVIGELKDTAAHSGIRKDRSLLPVERQVARYARSVFLAQNFRRYMYCFTLKGKVMRVLLFDRCGVCSSDAFDISVSPVRFVRILASFLTMEMVDLGYDPTYKEETEEEEDDDDDDNDDDDGNGEIRTAKKVKNLAMTEKDERYRLEERIHEPSTCVGRATVVWKATKAGSVAKAGDTNRVIIKDSWQSVNRAQEGEMLARVLRSEASLFPPDFVPQQRHHISEWPQPRRFATYVHHETVKDQGSIVDVVHSIRRIAGPDSITANADTVHRNCVRAVPGDYDRGNRELRRVIVEHVDCVKIETLRSLVDLFTAIRDCVDGHWAFYRAGLLHRDISKDNLMAARKWTGPGMSGAKFDYGFLIDLDFGADIDVSTRVGSGAPFATGNKAFMAREVLKWLQDYQVSEAYLKETLRDGDAEEIGERRSSLEYHATRFKQEYRHDLESFYWVFLWSLFNSNKRTRVNMANTFGYWTRPDNDFRLVYMTKANYLAGEYHNPRYFSDFIPRGMSRRRGQGLERLLVSFSDIFADTSAIAALQPEELYCRFQRGLTEMIDHLRRR